MSKVKVLSIDGGGIRGIIPAMVLDFIEKETGKAISDLFHLISGTSTGGILALGFVLPDQDGSPLYTAKEGVRFCEEEGPIIFACPRIYHVIYDEKYSNKALKKALKKHFGEHRLSEARSGVMVTSYDIENRMPRFFKSRKAEREGDFLMRDAARATAAGPTYFEPYELVPGQTGDVHGTLVDGGVIANSPAMCAYAEMLKHVEDYVSQSAEDEEAEILLVSLGTGRVNRGYHYQRVKNWGLLRWAQPAIDIFSEGMLDTIHYQLEQLLPDVNGERFYYRFQTPLEKENAPMDEASKENIASLKRAAKSMIKKQESTLKRLCEQLVED